MIIAVDFDGTCATHEFPEVGKDIGAVPVLKKLIKCGHKLILYTMRSDGQNNHPNVLNDAIKWFYDNDIPLIGINENPEQSSWTNSPKPYAHVYIDDAALGCPLIYDEEISERPFVDWFAIEEILSDRGII